MTKTFILRTSQFISFCSSSVNLMPRDVIAAGTPDGGEIVSGMYLSSGSIVDF